MLSRETPDSEDFELAGLPEGRKLNKRKVTSISRALASVDLEDIQPRSELSLPDDGQIAKVTTFDGVSVSVKLAKIDDKNWGTFSAAFVGDPVVAAFDAKAA